MVDMLHNGKQRKQRKHSSLAVKEQENHVDQRENGRGYALGGGASGAERWLNRGVKSGRTEPQAVEPESAATTGLVTATLTAQDVSAWQQTGTVVPGAGSGAGSGAGAGAECSECC